MFRWNLEIWGKQKLIPVSIRREYGIYFGAYIRGIYLGYTYVYVYIYVYIYIYIYIYIYGAGIA